MAIRTTAVALAQALALMLASGCGGSDSDVSEPDPGYARGGAVPVAGQGSDDVAEAAQRSFEAFTARDGQAYFNFLSQRCREEFEFAAVDAHVDGRHFRAELDGVDLTKAEVTDVQVDGGGDSAEVSLVVSGLGDAQVRESTPHRWIREGDGWYLDECDDITPAQGGLEGQGSDPDEPLELGFVADANGWLVVVTYIDLDGEALVIDLGGEPAAAGTQLATAQVNITYNGAQPTVTVGDELGFAMVSGDTVYGPEASCEVPGTDNGFYQPDVAVGPGESLGTPIVCREVATGDIGGLVMRVTHIPTGDEFWFQLG